MLAGRAVSDETSSSLGAESIQNIPPVVVRVGIGYFVRYLSSRLDIVGSGRNPVFGVAAQQADSLYLLRCPLHPSPSLESRLFAAAVPVSTGEKGPLVELSRRNTRVWSPDVAGETIGTVGLSVVVRFAG